MKNKEKQIEEMAEAIFQNCNCGLFFSEAEEIARFVIEEQGYRKEDDIAKEIFEKLYANIKFDGHTVSVWKNDLIEAAKEYGISLE